MFTASLFLAGPTRLLDSKRVSSYEKSLPRRYESSSLELSPLASPRIYSSQRGIESLPRWSESSSVFMGNLFLGNLSSFVIILRLLLLLHGESLLRKSLEAF